MSTLVLLPDLGSGGFSVQGLVGDDAGWSVSGAGDVNGDGFDDVIIGSPYNDAGGPNSGSAYVIFGRAGGFSNIDLANLTPAQGFKIQGSHFAGLSVSSAGDVNGDGFNDMIVGTFNPNGGAVAYVVFGKASPAATVDLASLAASDGFSIGSIGESSYYAGFAMSVSDAGDVNGDGFDDVIIGARYANGEKGVAYVVFGKTNGLGAVDLANLSAAQGFAIQGSALNDQLGTTVSSAGDVNGDGFDDVIVGAPQGDLGGTNAGQAYVIFGKATGFGTIDVTNLAPSAGFVIRGTIVNDSAGHSVSGAGDVNGDGFGDIVVSAPFAGTDAAYVIFGKATGFGAVDLNNLGGAGFIIRGINGDSAGYSVSAAGDVNNDGFDDLIVGAPGGNLGGASAAGQAYVIFGKASGFGTVDVAHLGARDGFILQAQAQFGNAGWSVSGAGDINHDGFADLVVGAPFTQNGGGSPIGRAYVILSSPSILPVRNDFNGDHRGDILWRSNSGWVSDWSGTANGAFAHNDANASNWAPSNWTVVGTGDFNGDGKTDILWRDDGGHVSDWLGTATGGFANNDANAATGAPLDWHIVDTGDFNGDGKSDILWRSDAGWLSNWLGTANGGFIHNDANATSWAPADWHVVGTGDFNGDGKSDILWRSDAGWLSEWLGTATGGFIHNDANATSWAPGDWHVVGTGDFNGDGRSDILWRSEAGWLSNWLGTANGGFVHNDANATAWASTSWNIVGVDDFNGDGRSDILWSDAAGHISNWLGTAIGGFVNNDANAATGAPIDWHVQPNPAGLGLWDY
jgi:hypothetical protein